MRPKQVPISDHQASSCHWPQLIPCGESPAGKALQGNLAIEAGYESRQGKLVIEADDESWQISGI